MFVWLLVGCFFMLMFSFYFVLSWTPKNLVDLGFTIRRIRPDVLVPIADEWTLPWAAEEERVMKRAMLAAAKADRMLAPWFEIYAVI